MMNQAKSDNWQRMWADKRKEFSRALLLCRKGWDTLKNVNSSLFPLSLVSPLGSTGKGLPMFFCSLPSGISIHWWDLPEPSLLQAGQSQLSQSFLIWKVSQSLTHFCGPSVIWPLQSLVFQFSVLFCKCRDLCLYLFENWSFTASEIATLFSC